MSAQLLIIEAANLFINGERSQTSQTPRFTITQTPSKAIKIRNVEIPRLEEIKIPHYPGGAPGPLEISVGIQPLEIPFALEGIDAETMAVFGASQINQNGFFSSPQISIYQVLRDKVSSSAQGLVAIVNGRISSAEFDMFRRGGLAGVNYIISEITYYSLTINGAQIYLYDWGNQKWNVNNISQDNGILRPMT